MLRVENYLVPERLADLCLRIDMPEEVAKGVVDYARNEDFSLVGDAFEQLFSLNTGKEAIEHIEEQYPITTLKPLTVYLAAVLHTHEIYKELGISDEIFYDSMKSFTRFVREHKVSFGIYGFDRGFWMYRCLSGSLFRIGTLEFEMVICKDTQLFELEGSNVPVLSVHIPSDAVLSREELEASYAGAKEFFQQYFSDFRYHGVYCRSWLISPVLKELLPDTSKIIIFQSDFRILHCNMEDDSANNWIFKRRYDDYSELPENTSLERNAKQLLLAGKSIGSALGVLVDKMGL